MPMSRYELRNEFTLADPDLYRTADKDDPEALLEGVAMSGLVGLLRQLGDLAEFAAEIFHDLHEEVMVTAARGHGLMIRVQQLEAEAPSIEKAFLSQTDHSSFSYNTGVEWHPSLQMEKNLVTRGDLPRFIMDSYEECRGPPRLFLLDKFDIAGAGACLKRYTDPSFFKVELSSSEMTNAEVQRKKKILRAKTKGPRWRNGETTPEVLTSHVKLNQLFVEVRVENGVSHSTRRVKLKRRLNGFPFDSNTGKSYMDELLKTTFPEHKELHEVTMTSLIVPANNHNESSLEVLEVGLMSPDRESKERKRSPSPSPSPSPDRLEIILKQSIHKPNEVFIDDEISEASNSYPDIVNKGIALTLDMVTNEEDMTVDGESKLEGSLTDYQSDDISSEIDNYVDAPSTMESEMDTDTELRVKSGITSSFTKRQQLISDANEEISYTNEEQAHTPADSHSTENSTISNDGNNSSRKELSNFTPSDSPSTSNENTESECDDTAISSPSADVFESSTIDMPSYHNTTQEDLPVSQHSKSMISDDTCTGTAAITNHRSDLDRLTSSLSPVDLTPTLAHFDLESVSKEGRLRGPETNETFSPLDQEDNRASLVIDQSCSPSAPDSEMQSGDNYPRFSGGDHLVDKSNGDSIPCLATMSGNLCHTSDSPVALSADFLHDWYSDQEDLNLSVDKASTSNICNAHPQNRDDTLSLISIENPNPNESDDWITKVPENSISVCPGIAHNGDSFTSTVSEGEKLMDDLDNEDPYAFSDASCIMEASLGKKFGERSSGNVQNVDIEGQYSNSSVDKQLGTQNYILSHVEHSLDWHGKNLDPQYGNGVIPIEQTTTAETPSVRIHKFCEEGLQNTEIPDDVYSHDSAALGSSSHDLEKLEKTSRTSDTVVNYKNTLCTSSIGQEVTKISCSSYLTSLNEVHVLLDATDCRRDQSETGVMAISVPAIAGSDNNDDASLLVDLDKSVEGSIPCFEDLGLNKLNDGENCLSGCCGESDLLELVGQRAAAASDLSIVFCNTVVYGNLKPEVSDTVPDSYLELGVEHSLDLVSDTTIQSSLGPIDFDTDQESFKRSGLGNHVSDTPSLTVECSTEVTISQEKIELSPNQLDQNLLNSDEIHSESSPLLPINPGQMLDHDDHKVGGNSASTISHVNCPCALSISEFPEQSNYVIDVSGPPKEPLGSTFPPSNPFSETIQIDMEELPPLPPLPPVQWRMGKLQQAFSASEGEIMQHTKLSSLGVFPPTTSIDDASSSHELPNQSLNQIIPDTTSKEVEVEKGSSLEANNMKHETIDLPQSTENEKQQLVVSYSESGFISPAVENGVANGNHADKLPRPRNPLIDAVAAIDKSKLRKVKERVRPEIQKLDERDSLLEQIRTKSFNLKPALASRPSIRGPKTNLKVAAILEKANAIRQALADSDEDDEGGWSDS